MADSPFAPGMRNLKQVVTYWAPTAGTNRYGEVVYASPVRMSARVEEQTVEVQTVEGEVVQAKTVITVPQDVVEGGYLIEGDFTSELDLTKVDGARRVQAFRSQPDLRNMSTSRRAYL